MTNPAPASVELRDALFDAIHEMAAKDPRLIFITADMGSWSLSNFREHLPKQFINIGIAEQNMLGVAAGLALAGKRVFVYAIIPFLVLRCLEQIKVDLCLPKLPVTLIGGGPGICYASDGPTHHAVEDVALMRALPGITIFNPCDHFAARAAVRQAAAGRGPVYIRLDKGKPPTIHNPKTRFADGLIEVKSGNDLVLIGSGIMTQQAFKVAAALGAAAPGVGIADLFRIAPLPAAKLRELAGRARRIATLEEHLLAGGIGSALSEFLTDNNLRVPLKRIGIGGGYCEQYGAREWMQQTLGLDAESIAKEIRPWLRKF
jgi:transketolase